MTAIIDIGSNSVRLMLWADGKVFYKKVNTTRLAETLSATGVLSETAMERTARAVAEYAEEGRLAGGKVYAFATAAVRSAGNGAAFCKRVKELSGLDVDVVSGEREACLGLLGALGTGDGGVIDLGGASTEVVFRKGGKITFSVSMPLGAVRLYELCRDDRSALKRETEEKLRALEGAEPNGRIYALGGTATTLAAVTLGLTEYHAEKIQDCPLRLFEITRLSELLFSLSVEERMQLPGMDKRRADIIAGGAYFLASVMNKLSVPKVYASDRDNLEGYLFERGLQ